MSGTPLVSCIMLTANRQKFVPLAINNFLRQDYESAELIVIDDGADSAERLVPKSEKIKYFYSAQHLGTIGAKRNYACNRTNGEVIMHWDDDDYYAPDWITKQVNFLIDTKSDICGIEHVHFYSPLSDTFWLGTSKNRNNGNFVQFLSGATLAYWKSYWQEFPFEDRNTGEDDSFITQHHAIVYAHDYIDGFVAILHPRNTTIKYFEHPNQKQLTR